MPFVMNTAHQQRTIKLNRPPWESGFVVEVAGLDSLDIERLHVLVLTAQLKPIVATISVGGGIAQRPLFKEVGCFRHGRKY